VTSQSDPRRAGAPAARYVFGVPKGSNSEAVRREAEEQPKRRVVLQVGVSAGLVCVHDVEDGEADEDLDVVEVESRSRLMRRERTYCPPEPWPKYKRREEDGLGEDVPVQDDGVRALQNSASLGVRSMIFDHEVREESGFSNRDCVFARSLDGLRIYVPVLHGM